MRLRLVMKLLVLKSNFRHTSNASMAFHTTLERMKIILDSQWICDDSQTFPENVYSYILHPVTGISKEPSLKV